MAANVDRATRGRDLSVNQHADNQKSNILPGNLRFKANYLVHLHLLALIKSEFKLFSQLWTASCQLSDCSLTLGAATED